MTYLISGRTLTTGTAHLTTALLLLGLTACGGGGGGSNGGIGTLDPLVEDFGIAYVRQPVPEEDTTDIRDPASFTPGGQLIFRDLASPDARESNLTASVIGDLGDVKDVEASFDGSKLVFALRLPDIENAAPEDQPTWNIWEYDIATNALIRVMQSDIQAENGQDVAPHYLADGRIIFSSTRQRTSKAILLDEGKPQFLALDESLNTPAFVLHTMEADGTTLKQVTFNQSHDLDPVVLESGEVVFSRWDNSGPNNAIHLYKMNPDGTNLQLLYGANSHETGTNGATVQFTQARELPDGELMTLLKPFTGAFQGGDIIKIDTANYVDRNQTTAPNQGILTGPAQKSIAFTEIRSDNLPSPGGRFNSFYPFWDGTNRALITWSQCRLLENGRIVPCTADRLSNPNAAEAPPLYSVYLYDMDKQTQLPIFIPQEGVLYRDAVATQPRQLPTIISDGQAPPSASFDLDPRLISQNQNLGILNIRSVYDFDGSFNSLGSTATDIETLANPNLTTTADDRPARFLRIVKPVSMPGPDQVNLRGTAFGRSTAQLMREIIGYAPIEPDGSVRIKVPANIPFAISILDKNGKRISERHQNWLQLRPGEVMTCNGCHTGNSGVSHGRADLFPALNSGAPTDPYTFNDSLIFGNFGDSMAEARARSENKSAQDLSMDIVYEDVWWTDAGGLPLDTPFDYSYADLDPIIVTPTPPLSPLVKSGCLAAWTADCRIIINYETHIHPIWNRDRAIGKCTTCHAEVDAMGATMVPAGQLDLSDGADQQVVEHFKSYRELFFGDLAQSLDANGQLVDQVQDTNPDGSLKFQQASDANGNLLFIQQTDGGTPPVPLFVEATDADVLLLDLNGDPALVPLFTEATDAVGAPLIVQLFDLTTGDPTVMAQAFAEGTDINGDPLLIQDFDARGISLVPPAPRQAIDAAGNPMFYPPVAPAVIGDPVLIPLLTEYMEPVFISVNVPQVMNVAGALASPDFFSIFEDPANTDHFGNLTTAELKLIAEWLDIGGQYYNNPFDVPQ